MPSNVAVETRWAAIRARLHTGTTTYVGTCRFRAPDRSTLRSGSRLLAASTAIQRSSP
ncbi:4-oxalomesaconate hydratase [Xanthomonas oryzae]|nr:4-oxalomesaconate hydratase [Xanthomonas oryzae]